MSYTVFVTRPQLASVAPIPRYRRANARLPWPPDRHHRWRWRGQFQRGPRRLRAAGSAVVHEPEASVLRGDQAHHRGSNCVAACSETQLVEFPIEAREGVEIVALQRSNHAVCHLSESPPLLRRCARGGAARNHQLKRPANLDQVQLFAQPAVRYDASPPWYDLQQVFTRQALHRLAQLRHDRELLLHGPDDRCHGTTRFARGLSAPIDRDRTNTSQRTGALHWVDGPMRFL